MELKRWNFLVLNIMIAIIFISIMVTVNLKINRMEIDLNYFILPILCAILFGCIITSLFMKRTRYLEKRIGEKTKELEHYAAELEHYASMDDMTNTYNRRMGLKMLKNHFSLSKRHKKNLSVCFVDIDKLKSVNDNFGHVEGDELIRHISEMLRSSIRESDIVSRMGGDEFLIILPECDVEDANKIMKKLTEKIRTYNDISQKGYRTSVSFGISEFSYSEERTVEDLLIEADNKMYSMKNSTRSTSYENLYSLEKNKQMEGVSIETSFYKE